MRLSLCRFISTSVGMPSWSRNTWSIDHCEAPSSPVEIGSPSHQSPSPRVLRVDLIPRPTRSPCNARSRAKTSYAASRPFANSWVSQESKLETGLGGWGARIRTWEWRNQNPQKPLTHIEFLFSYCICVAPSVESAFSSERDRAEHLTGRDALLQGQSMTQCMVRPCVARGFHRSVGFAVLQMAKMSGASSSVLESVRRL